MDPSPRRSAAEENALPIAAAAVTIVLWASAFVGVRAAGHDYSPGALALGRQIMGSAALTLVVFVSAVRRGKFLRLPRGGRLVAVLGWGASWFGLYNLAPNTTEQHLDAGTTALLVNLAPVLIGVLSGLFLGEGFPSPLMIGLGVSFVGVVLIALTTWTGRGDLVGVLFGLAAAVLYASSATAQKRLLVRIDALTLTWLGCLAGTIVCVPFAPQLAREAATAPISSTIAMIYLGVFPTAIAFLTWAYALSRTSAGRLAASTYVIPPLVVVLSWTFLAEIPAFLAFVGGGLCLFGVAIAMRRNRPRGAAAPS